MSLRITQNMLFSGANRDIHSGLIRYSRLQQQVASGRRVNRPSDDPAAALRIIPLTSEIQNLEQLGENVSLAREVLNTGASSLEDGSSIMQRARELTVQAANGTISERDRGSIAAEIDQLLQQMIGVANARRGGRFLFGGTETDEPPFRIVDAGSSSRVDYTGNRQSVLIEVAPGVDTELTLAGDEVFFRRNRSTTEFTPAPGQNPTGIRAGSGTDSGIGFQQLAVSFRGLDGAPAEITAGSGSQQAVGPLAYSFAASPDRLSIDGGPTVAIPITDGVFTTGDGRQITLTVTGVPATLNGSMTAIAGLSSDEGQSVVEVTDFTQTNVQLINGLDGSVMNLDVSNLTRTGNETAKFAGTFDTFTALISLRDLLENDADLPEQEVTNRLSGLLDEIDTAHEGVLDGLRELGFRSSSMDLLGSRVDNLQISRAQSLSQAQDTDLADAILELQRQDITYQASLQVAARVIQTSISGFLR